MDSARPIPMDRLRRCSRIAGAALCWGALVKAGLWTGALLAAAARAVPF